MEDEDVVARARKLLANTWMTYCPVDEEWREHDSEAEGRADLDDIATHLQEECHHEQEWHDGAETAVLLRCEVVARFKLTPEVDEGRECFSGAVVDAPVTSAAEVAAAYHQLVADLCVAIGQPEGTHPERLVEVAAIAGMQKASDELALNDNGEDHVWDTCSGCCETGESMGLAHHYPGHPIHGCLVGAGCDECNYRGIVLRDYGVPDGPPAAKGGE